MRIRRFLVFILIILFAVSLKLNDAFQLLGTKVKAVPLMVSFNVLDADTEIGSPEEFQALISKGIKEAKDSIKMRIVNYNERDYDVNAALNKILDENVGLGFVSGCNVRFIKNMNKVTVAVELKMKYFYPGEKVAAMRIKANNKANEIIKAIIKPKMGEYEKVLAVHDYLIKSTKYDRLNADRNTVPPEGHEAYGVLVKGIGVCDGYSKAMKLLLEKAGVKCMLVEGSKDGVKGQRLDNVDHAWNIVMIEGEYYHVDATWNDVFDGQNSIDMVYHHFNLNDMEMQKTHVWDRNKYPKCTSTKYNYYTYNELTVSDREETISEIVKAISTKDEKLILKIANYKSSTYNIGDLIRKAASKCMLRQNLSAKWIVNDSLGIVDLQFIY